MSRHPSLIHSLGHFNSQMYSNRVHLENMESWWKGNNETVHEIKTSKRENCTTKLGIHIWCRTPCLLPYARVWKLIRPDLLKVPFLSSVRFSRPTDMCGSLNRKLIPCRIVKKMFSQSIDLNACMGGTWEKKLSQVARSGTLGRSGLDLTVIRIDRCGGGCGLFVPAVSAEQHLRRRLREGQGTAAAGRSPNHSSLHCVVNVISHVRRGNGNENEALTDRAHCSACWRGGLRGSTDWLTRGGERRRGSESAATAAPQPNCQAGRRRLQTEVLKGRIDL